MSGGGFASPAGEAPGGEAPQGRAEPGSPQFDDEGRESANLGEMQARMEALQVLSQRLRGSTGTAGMAAAPPPAAPSGSHSSGRSRSPASAGESRAAGAAGQLEQQLELEEQRPSPDPASMRIRELEASDEEEVGGWFSTGRATVSGWAAGQGLGIGHACRAASHFVHSLDRLKEGAMACSHHQHRVLTVGRTSVAYSSARDPQYRMLPCCRAALLRLSPPGLAATATMMPWPWWELQSRGRSPLGRCQRKRRSQRGGKREDVLHLR